MAGNNRHGRPDEEMFLQRDRTDPETPTVGPLRINKRESTTSPPPRTGSASSSTAGPYTMPAPSSQNFPAPPSFPPYPVEDGPPKQSRTPLSDRERTSKNSTPDDGRRRGSGSTNSPTSRPRFDANDPNRPSLAGYAHPPRANTGEVRDGQAQSSLAAKRGHAPKPLPESPGPDLPDKEGLFQRAPQRPTISTGTSQAGAQAPEEHYQAYHQQYYPPPGQQNGAAANAPTAVPLAQPAPTQQPAGLQIPNPQGVNRLSSTASTSTTRAQRGSPPPPETPIIDQAGGGIEARYAAAGIAGTSTLNSIQAQNAAAAQRQNQYGAPPRQATTSPPQQQQPPRRPWTPTEHPDSTPYGQPTVYQGMNELPANGPQPVQSPPAQAMSPPTAPIAAAATTAGANQARDRFSPEQHLEQDFQRMNVHEEAPPAYDSIHQPAGRTPQGYPNEKGRPSQSGPSGATQVHAGPPTAADLNLHGHPAFANDPRNQQGVSPQPFQPQQQPNQLQTQGQRQQATPSPGPAGPASPPPLPEGWISHLDPNSGQYYYIHLPTQATQWEFPKGPTPLNINDTPLSPTGTFVNPLTSPTFSKLPLASPGFPPQQAAYPEGMMSMGAIASPTAAGFTGPPPAAGADTYKVQPTNGVYFGPYLRYTNMDQELGLWLGSILIVTDAPQPPTIHIHQSVDLSPNPRQLKANPIFSHQRWMFYRYDIDLRMDEQSTKWTYAITSHLGCTRYEFTIAGRHETAWRFIAHSGNDFAMNVNANQRTALGGVGLMWKDILQQHVACGGFHVQLGLGNQIYADRMWKEIPLLREWTAMSGKENRKNAPWTATHEDRVSHAYFHYYTSHFDQPHVREAFAQIPHVLALDDHDIFDGFGSYPEYMQFSSMFKNIGRIGIEMYLLFQHHTTLEILRNVNDDRDLFTITGTGWHFLKYLGPAVVVVGPDTRSERNPHHVMAGPTYQGLFPKIAILPPSVQHCVWMIPVPLIYPRLESMEHFASTMATGKKAVTGSFNILGKVTGSVAGVVGAKGMVNEGFGAVKKAVGKSGLMSNVLSPFGDIDMLDELRDQWTHESKDLERTYLIRTLQGISHNKSMRMTFFSGGVDCCGAGLVHDPSKLQDHKTMYQIISSSVVNAPPSNYVLRLLHNSKALYVPANGHRSTGAVSDTKEDMMEIFTTDVNGAPREMKRLMGRRNYVAGVIYDPEIVNGTFGQTGQPQGGHGGGGKLSIAIDFMVQNEGTFGNPMKYGPVIIPSLEYGR